MKITQIKVAKVIHYFDKLNVAIVKLTKNDLKIGDSIMLTAKDGNKFNQVIKSMQIKHANIDITKTGDEFGLKTDVKVKIGSDVFKIK